jgi:hypothetical protein
VGVLEALIQEAEVQADQEEVLAALVKVVAQLQVDQQLQDKEIQEETPLQDLGFLLLELEEAELEPLVETGLQVLAEMD